MNKKEATVNYYVVRVYRRQEHIDPPRREAAADPQTPELTGLVETQSGERHAFHTAQELWRILGTAVAGGDGQPGVKR